MYETNGLFFGKLHGKKINLLQSNNLSSQFYKTLNNDQHYDIMSFFLYFFQLSVFFSLCKCILEIQFIPVIMLYKVLHVHFWGVFILEIVNKQVNFYPQTVSSQLNRSQVYQTIIIIQTRVH